MLYLRLSVSPEIYRGCTMRSESTHMLVSTGDLISNLSNEYSDIDVNDIQIIEYVISSRKGGTIDSHTRYTQETVLNSRTLLFHEYINPMSIKEFETHMNKYILNNMKTPDIIKKYKECCGEWDQRAKLWVLVLMSTNGIGLHVQSNFISMQHFIPRII